MSPATNAILAANDDVDHLVVYIFNLTLKTNLLEVEHHFGDILHHTFDGAELVLHTFDADLCYGIALQAGEHNAAERIADGHTKSWLQWTEFKPSAEVIRLEHNDLVWLLKIENRHFGCAGL